MNPAPNDHAERPFVDAFVGIDVSKRTLDVELLRAPEHPKPRYHAANDDDGFMALLTWLAEQDARPETTVVCLENTGIYDDRLLEALTLAGYRCAVEKTTVLQKVRPEHHRKDDAFDAALLAEYAYRYQDKLRFWQAPHPTIEQIRLLYGERRRLLSQRGAVLQRRGEARLQTAKTDFAEALWQEQIAFFEAQLERIEAELKRLVDSDADIRHRYRLVNSLPGFGPVMSLLWLVLFYGQARLDAREIASRFGFAPHAERSGTSRQRQARSSGHGKSEVRKVLTLCARSVGRHDAKLRAYKEKKLSEGKPSQLVTNNVINKLIRTATTMWNQEAFYDPEHVSPFARKPALSP